MPPAAERSDGELLAAARRGDARAFQHLVERYESRVAAVVVSMLGPGPDADDVGQETFIRFYESIDRFRGDARLGTYITRIAINQSLKALRRRRKWHQRFFSRDADEARAGDTRAGEARPGEGRPGDLLPGEGRPGDTYAEESSREASGAAGPAGALLESERAEMVQRALRQLSAEHRSVVVLRILEGYSTRETSAMLGLPEGTVMSRLSRGLARLEDLLGPMDVLE